MLEAPHPAPTPPRTGMIYDTLTSLNEGLARVEEKQDAMNWKLDQSASDFTDHELRIRTLEEFKASHSATQSATSGTAQWIWQALLALGMLLLGVLTYLK